MLSVVHEQRLRSSHHKNQNPKYKELKKLAELDWEGETEEIGVPSPTNPPAELR
jgi:hypothetical protein